MSPVIRCGARVREQALAHERAGRLAATLRATGSGPGDRIAVLLRNDIEFLEVCLAVAASGANPVPVNTRWQAPEIAHILRDSGARIIFAHTASLAAVERASELAGVTPLIVEVPMSEALGAAPQSGRHRTLEDLVSDSVTPLGHVEGAIADSMGLIYTSGTTGAPKGVLRERMTPHQLLAVAGGTAQRMGLTPDARILVAGPLYHTSPNAVAVLALRMGVDITILPRWDAVEFLRVVAAQGITQAKVVPTMLSRLLALPANIRRAHDISSLTQLIHSAAPCPLPVKRAAIDWFGDAVTEFYGCTETGAVTWIGADEWLAHPGSVGRGADGSAAMVATAEGDPLPPGEIGRVYVRGADYWPAFRYLGHDESDSAVPGFVHVGDTGYLDEDGYLYLTGRSSEIVVSGGVNIYPAEIESALLEFDGVEDAAVFGIPDAGDLGEVVAAHVVARPGATLSPDDLRAGLAERLARYKIPRELRIVPALPRDDSGKIYKRLLRAEYRN